MPRRASRGERYAAIFAELASRPNGGNVLQVNRVGVRIYLDVGTGGDPPTDFRVDDLAVRHGPGKWQSVTAQVHNTGERALDMTGSLTLTRVGGTTRAGPYAVRTGITILPGQNGQVRATLNEPLPAGRWKAHMTLASGTVTRSADRVLTLSAQGGATMRASAQNGWLGSALLPGAIVALALVVGVFLWYRIRRARRAAAGPKP